MKSYINSFFLFPIIAVGLLATSCLSDEYGIGEETMCSPVTISAYCSEMLVNYTDPTDLGSRGNDPKSDAERKINTLHIFFFDENGNFLTGDYDNFKPYQKVTNSFTKITPGALNGMDKVRIVALANIDGSDEVDDDRFDVVLPDGTHLAGEIENGTRDTGTPYTIRNLQDLENWRYAPRIRMEDEKSDISHLPSAGMPMYYMTEAGQSLNLNLTSGNLNIPMTAMMARVDITVKLEPKQESTDKRLPSLTITSYGIKNVPVTIQPFKNITGASESTCTDAEIYVDGNGSTEIEVTEGPSLNIPLNKASSAVKFTYYTYENVRLPNYDAVRTNGKKAYQNGTLTFPDGVDTDVEKQRWKSTIARTDVASALTLKGTYTTDQGLTYKAQFTVYMGANPIDDFKVERNHQYSNHIVIHGLDYIRNSDDNAYTFDGRINVVDDNPFYLAIINERMVDAHATALPMDVWLMYREDGGGDQGATTDHNSTVTVKIPEDCDWIRMVMVPRKEMAGNEFKPGTGIEPYFTTDLFDRIDNKSIIAGKSGWQCGKEITIESTPTLNNSRARVYFYIDENVPSSNNPNMTNPNAGDYYGNRMATVSVIYDTDKDGGDHRERKIEIEQRALVKCNGNHPQGDVGTLWMEYYEEYLEHYDPLDQHLAPGEYYTDGLPWGLQRSYASLTTNTTEDVYEIYTQGYQMTGDVVRNSVTKALNTIQLYNDDVPESAFHYCYGKNKRTDSSGNTALTTIGTRTVGWYMPGIRELESVLSEHYLSFTEFQNNFYWSASAAKQYTGSFLGIPTGTGENTDRARATKVIQTTPVRYAESGSRDDTDNFTNKNGTTGRATRDTALRIRAFYKAE